MSENQADNKQLSRRDLLRRAGLAGLSVVTIGVADRVSVPLSVASAADGSPEGFLAYAYAQRARAMTTGDVRLLDGLYDPANDGLLSFERSRARFFFHGLLAIWDNATLLGYASTVSLTILTQSGTRVKAEIYETVSMEWIPTLPPETPARIEARKRYPQRFEPIIAIGPRGEVTSSFGAAHTVVLERSASGWRFVSDAYDESLLYAASPDLPPDQKVGGGGPTQVTTAPAPPNHSGGNIASGCITYEVGNAVNYAIAHCTKANYNTNFCNYCYGTCTCYGDCTNFVSQCLNAGNQISDKYWYALGGTCPCSCQSSKFVGSNTWVNCGQLRSWAIGNGRATSETSISALGNGDLVSYSWNNNGYCDHIAMFTGAPYNNVSCHCLEACNMDWRLGSPNAGHWFTHINDIYNC